MALLPDVTGLLDDVDVGSGVGFTVVRQTKTRSLEANATRNVTKQITQKTGNIQPAQTEDLRLLPEEERKETVIVIRSTFLFQTGSDNGATYVSPDIVLYDEKVWKVIRADKWDAWGFSCAYCKLQRGESPSQYQSTPQSETQQSAPNNEVAQSTPQNEVTPDE